MNKHVSIAIDGPAGAGKSTMAKAVAREMGFYYVDTGAIYRTVALFFSIYGVSPKDADGIARFIDEINLEIRYAEDGAQHMLLNGQDVTGELRTTDISDLASKFSAQKVVRDLLLDTQRDLARKHSVVMDGRDIGTVVLPDADVKIFLTASPEVRAKRRWEEMRQKGDQKTSYNAVLAEMKERDQRDTNRAVAPLKCAPDAVKLDTSGFSIEESIQAIEEIIRKKLGQ